MTMIINDTIKLGKMVMKKRNEGLKDNYENVNRLGGIMLINNIKTSGCQLMIKSGAEGYKKVNELNSIRSAPLAACDACDNNQ